MRKFFDWLEDRSGYRAWLKTALDEPVPGGASWAFVFGSVITFVLVLQIVTGLLLASYYSPSSTTAWASVAYVQDQVTLGWFVRGLHSKGASAMVVVTGLHMLQVFVYGAYKKPRELNWLVGLAMFGLILAFALTGYLLPWDQKGYNATKVATSLMGAVPGIGRWLQGFVQGGNDYGNLTLTRFYTAHVLLLPGALLALLGLHLSLFRRHGVTPRWGQSKETLARTTQPFWPDQLLRDAVAMVIAIGFLVGLVVLSHGAELSAPADPSKPYEARPEWYFLPLFQLLKYFQGGMTLVGAMVLPGLFALLLAALPFVDRSPGTDPSRRRGVLLAFFAGVASVVVLGALAKRQDDKDPVYKKNVAEATLAAHIARAYVKQHGFPQSARVPTTVRELEAALKKPVDPNDPVARVEAVWNDKCLGCHPVAGAGDGEAPDLAGYNTRPWIEGFLRNPSAPHYYGRSKTFIKEGMKQVVGTDDELAALTEFVYALQGPELAPDVDTAKADAGRELYASDRMQCTNCHSLEGREEGDGPNLGGRGSRAYLLEVLKDPGQAWLYGIKNDMPAFGSKLPPGDLEALVDRVLALRKVPMK